VIATDKPVAGCTELADDGSTASGCWVYAGCYQDGVNQFAHPAPGREHSGVDAGWSWAWPTDRRLMDHRASAAPHGTPRRERKRYVWNAERRRWAGIGDGQDR
jgi:formate dehydrogenase major subunit